MFGQDDETAAAHRPNKRRKVSKSAAAAGTKRNQDRSGISSEFVPLLNGAEKIELVQLRQRQFAASWGAIDARIQVCPPPPPK